MRDDPYLIRLMAEGLTNAPPPIISAANFAKSSLQM
jgi:hypothetical protein